MVDHNDRYTDMVHDTLGPGEKITLIVKQSRWWPGVPINSIFKPVIVFLTNERLIIVSRHWLGLLRNVTIVPLTAVRTTRLEKGLILASVVLGQLGPTPGSENSVDGMTYHDASLLLRHLTREVHTMNRPMPIREPLELKADRCYNCGTPIIAGEKYCYHCGARLY
ncbi:MAG: hypothetical protein KGH49_02935 [Candidatus Micrarchaeota archaeon]|nr:hypothetical protein [Candidatus Micrarchaeota archaeon]